jgi:hypothetical protein
MNRYTATRPWTYHITSPQNNVTLEEALYLESIEPAMHIVQVISPFQEY